jgi:hypothetical protein
MYCVSYEVRTEFLCYVEGSKRLLWSSGQSSWLHNADLMCFLWGMNWIYIYIYMCVCVCVEGHVSCISEKISTPLCGQRVTIVPGGHSDTECCWALLDHCSKQDTERALSSRDGSDELKDWPLHVKDDGMWYRVVCQTFVCSQKACDTYLHFDKIQAALCFETSVNFWQTTRCHIWE